MKLSKEEIHQAWMDMANDMIKECGDWPNEPDNPELVNRIMKRALEYEKNRDKGTSK